MNAECSLNCTLQSTHYPKVTSKWLLKREKLEEIAKSLEPLVQQIKFQYPKDLDGDLSGLQDYCFQVVFEVCEQGKMASLQKICHVIQGLTDSSGNTVLSLYVQRENNEKIGEIVNAGLAMVLSRNETPLHVALKLGKTDYVETMRSKGYGVNVDLDHKGRLPLHIAVKKGRTDLIENLQPKADGLGILNIPYHSNKQNLDLCALALSVLKGQIACLDMVKQLGKIPLASLRVGAEKMTLLHLAIHANQLDTLKHLLTIYFEDTKTLLNIPDGKGYTPIILAAHLGDSAAATLLIEKGANIESRDFRGRTALHHAAFMKQVAVIRVLAAYRAELKPLDLDGKTPLQLVEGQETFKNAVSDFMDKCKNGDLNYGGNFAVNPPENLVFKGGGPKGIAYLGAIKVLERKGIFTHVRRVAGTSAGAMTAVLLAVGCNSEEAENLLIETSGMYFLDHSFTEERMETFAADHSSIKLLKEAYDTISECITNVSPVPAFKRMGSKLLNGIWTCTGVCEGKRFLNWIEKQIGTRTGIERCTFGELADLIAQGKTNPEGRPFKHLHVFATKMSGGKAELVRFSSEDPAYKDLIISEATRASVSIPVVFKPHILIFKQKMGDGKYQFFTQNKTFVSLNYNELMNKLRTAEHVAEASHIDGGLIYNFPIGAFDQRGYVHYGVPEEEKKYHQFNRRTLGFSLYSTEENETKVHKLEAVENIGQLLIGVYSVFRHAETLIDKMDCDPREKDRIIALDNKGISLLAFNTNPMAGKGAHAMDAAEKTTEEFFAKQEKEVAGFLPAPSVKLPVKTQIPRAVVQAEWVISEAEAKKLLTLGPRAQHYISLCNAKRGVETAQGAFLSIFIITLPIVAPALTYLHHEPKSLKSRKLELLAYDDERFAFFESMGKGDFKGADAVFNQNQAFFKALMKTYVFTAALKKCLLNCDNKYYYYDSEGNDPQRFRLYLDYFTQKRIIPLIIPRDFVYDLPDF